MKLLTMKKSLLLSLLLSSLLLTACGQMGPLYLADEEKEVAENEALTDTIHVGGHEQNREHSQAENPEGDIE